ncbi:hypothetical protein [Brevundimonas diminuta]|uniref:hypothetical protein n=1 Tax=Brevundimonas diminuta TaxID=293 RepID=UPI003D359AA2
MAAGDDARLHIGVTAQTVVEAFEAEGLDPWAYAQICRDFLPVRVARTRQVERPIVETVEAPVTRVEIHDGRPVMVCEVQREERPVGRAHGTGRGRKRGRRRRAGWANDVACPGDGNCVGGIFRGRA